METTNCDKLKLLNDSIEDIVITDNDIFIHLNKNIVIQSNGHIVFNSTDGNIISLGKQIHMNPTLKNVIKSKDIDVNDEREVLNTDLRHNNLSRLVNLTDIIQNISNTLNVSAVNKLKKIKDYVNANNRPNNSN